jgi:ribosomal protein S18 acetylase RimI-like enzyme
MQIRPISYSEALLHVELLKAYAEECSIPEIGSTDPQIQMYEAMERIGVAQCFGVYAEKLVGFASLLMTVLPHYGKKVATVESIYVDPEYRPFVGKNLLLELENYAKDAGCVAILYSAPAESRFERMLTLRKDYRRSNSVFTRSL